MKVISSGVITPVSLNFHSLRTWVRYSATPSAFPFTVFITFCFLGRGGGRPATGWAAHPVKGSPKRSLPPPLPLLHMGPAVGAGGAGLAAAPRWDKGQGRWRRTTRAGREVPPGHPGRRVAEGPRCCQPRGRAAGRGVRGGCTHTPRLLRSCRLPSASLAVLYFLD